MCVTYTTGYSEHNSLLSDGVLLNNSPHTLSYRKQCRWNQAVTRLLRIQNWKRSHFLSCWDLSMSAQTNRLYSPQNLWCWQCCDGICCTVHVLKGPFAFMIYLFLLLLLLWALKKHSCDFGMLRYWRLRTSCISLWETAVDLHKLSESADYWLSNGEGGKKAHLQAVEAEMTLKKNNPPPPSCWLWNMFMSVMLMHCAVFEVDIEYPSTCDRAIFCRNKETVLFHMRSI